MQNHPLSQSKDFSGCSAFWLHTMENGKCGLPSKLFEILQIVQNLKTKDCNRGNTDYVTNVFEPTQKMPFCFFQISENYLSASFKQRVSMS